MAFTGGLQQYFPFAPGVPAGTAPGSVTSVTATLPIISSGGTTPNISLQIPLPIVDGGTGTATPSLIAGANVTITGAWPDQTISSSGSGGGVASVTASSPLTSTGGSNPNISIANPLPITNGGTGTATPSLIAGTGISITGSWPNETISTSAGAPVTSVTGSGNILSSGGTTPNITTVASPTFTSVTATGAVASNTLAVAASAAVGTALTVGSTIAALGRVTSAVSFGTPNTNGILGLFNVVDFGATGNGVTNDYIAIAATLAAASSGPSIVFFPLGTYVVNTTLTVPANVTLMGFSRGSAIITGTANPLVTVSGFGLPNGSPAAFEQYASCITNLVFVGTGTTQTLLAMAGPSYAPASGVGVLIFACNFVGTNSGTANLITLKFGASTTFTNCIITGANNTQANVGVALTSTSTTLFTGCTIQQCSTCIVKSNNGNVNTPDQGMGLVNCYFENSAQGISSTGSYNWYAVGCQFANLLGGVTAANDSAVYITNNFFGITTGNPININSVSSGVNPTNTWVITGNTFNNYGTAFNAFISISSAAGYESFGFDISSNQFNANGVSPQPNYCLYLAATAAINFHDNFLFFAPAISFTLNSSPVIANQLVGAHTWASGLHLPNLVTTFRNNVGLNPFGAFATAPAFPGSGVFMTNATNYDVTVYISGGVAVGVAVAGTSGTVTTFGLSSGSFRVPSGALIAVAYSSVPTWVWVGD